jgi:outer membrane protein TolC
MKILRSALLHSRHAFGLRLSASTLTQSIQAALRFGLGLAFASPGHAASAPPTGQTSPLSLDDAIRLALQKNQALKVSAFTPDIARANLLAEYGRFDPARTFRRSYREGEAAVSTTPLTRSLTQGDDYALSLDGLTPWGLTYSLGATAENQRGSFNRFTDNFVTFGGVSVTQPLLRGFGFGANLAGLRLARADRGIADWQHRQTIIDTVTGVILAYTSLAQARENVRIAQLSRDLTAQLVDQNEKRNRAGQISDADVIQARARLAARDEQVLLAQRAAADLQNQFRQLIGETTFSSDGPALALEPLAPASPPPIDAAADLKRAYELRPDFQAARLGVGKRQTSRAVAQNQLLPRLDFVGSYGYTGMDRDFGTARRQVRDQDVRAYSAGVVVSLPLTFAEGRGRVRAAQLSLRQTEADLVRLEQDIAVEISAAAGQIETTRQRVAATRSALDLARQALEAEQKKLQAGSGRTLDVLTAQEQLALVESSYARALADQRRALATYDRATGTTLARHQLRTD